MYKTKYAFIIFTLFLLSLQSFSTLGGDDSRVKRQKYLERPEIPISPGVFIFFRDGPRNVQCTKSIDVQQLNSEPPALA